jgi:hypothetical protein
VRIVFCRSVDPGMFLASSSLFSYACVSIIHTMAPCPQTLIRVTHTALFYLHYSHSGVSTGTHLLYLPSLISMSSTTHRLFLALESLASDLQWNSYILLLYTVPGMLVSDPTVCV